MIFPGIGRNRLQSLTGSTSITSSPCAIALANLALCSSERQKGCITALTIPRRLPAPRRNGSLCFGVCVMNSVPIFPVSHGRKFPQVATPTERPCQSRVWPERDLPQLRHVLATLLRQFYIAAELGAADRSPQRSDPQFSSLKSAPADRDRLPVPLSAARIAFTVAAFGMRTSKGRAFSAATRTSNMRTASDTEMPIPASVFAGFC